MNKRQQLEEHLESLQSEMIEIKKEIANCDTFLNKLELIFSNFTVRYNPDDSSYDITSESEFCSISGELSQLYKINGVVVDVSTSGITFLMTVAERSN